MIAQFEVLLKTYFFPEIVEKDFVFKKKKSYKSLQYTLLEEIEKT